MENEQLVITKDDGSEELVNILFTYQANDKNYVIFEFNDTEEISAAVYIPDETGDNGTLVDIETDEEWDMIDEVLQGYYDDLEAEESLEDDLDDN